MKELSGQSKRRDLDKGGISLALDQARPPDRLDVASVTITIDPPIHDIGLAEALDAIVKGADSPIMYSIEDSKVRFFIKRQTE